MPYRTSRAVNRWDWLATRHVSPAGPPWQNPLRVSGGVALGIRLRRARVRLDRSNSSVVVIRSNRSVVGGPLDTIDHSESWIYKSEAAWTAPIGWSPDGGSIYAVEGKTRAARGLTPPLGETLTDARIVRIPLSGDPQTIARLPAQETGGISMTADARRFVYTVYSSRSDVWVVDNFDDGPTKQFSRQE